MQAPCRPRAAQMAAQRVLRRVLREMLGGCPEGATTRRGQPSTTLTMALAGRDGASWGVSCTARALCGRLAYQMNQNERLDTGIRLVPAAFYVSQVYLHGWVGPRVGGIIRIRVRGRATIGVQIVHEALAAFVNRGPLSITRPCRNVPNTCDRRLYMWLLSC